MEQINEASVQKEGGARLKKGGKGLYIALGVIVLALAGTYLGLCAYAAEAAACGELLYDILAELGPITPAIALPLYVAVSTDTGCFAYANTTPHTHAVAAALMRTGIDYRAVNKTFFRTKSRKRMQLEGAMMNGCEFYDRLSL